MTEDSRVKTERNQVDKFEGMKKKKKEDVQCKKLIAAPREAIKNLLLKSMCHQKM